MSFKHQTWTGTAWLDLDAAGVGGGGGVTQIISNDKSVALNPVGGIGVVDLIADGHHVFAIADGDTLTIPVNRQFDHLGSFLVNGRKIINGRFVLGIGANV